MRSLSSVLFCLLISLGIYHDLIIAYVVYFLLAGICVGLLSVALLVLKDATLETLTENQKGLSFSNPTQLIVLIFGTIPFNSVLLYTESWNTLLASLLALIMGLYLKYKINLEIKNRKL